MAFRIEEDEEVTEDMINRFSKACDLDQGGSFELELPDGAILGILMCETRVEVEEEYVTTLSGDSRRVIVDRREKRFFKVSQTGKIMSEAEVASVINRLMEKRSEMTNAAKNPKKKKDAPRPGLELAGSW